MTTPDNPKGHHMNAPLNNPTPVLPAMPTVTRERLGDLVLLQRDEFDGCAMTGDLIDGQVDENLTMFVERVIRRLGVAVIDGDVTLAAVRNVPAVPFDLTSLDAVNALPVGTILTAHEKLATPTDLPDDSVWVVIAPGTARLLSHHTAETEALDWFLRDGGAITVWSHPLLGRTAVRRPESSAGSIGHVTVRLYVTRVDEAGSVHAGEAPYSYLTLTGGTVVESTLDDTHLEWLAQDISELDPNDAVVNAVRDYAGIDLANIDDEPNTSPFITPADDSADAQDVADDDPHILLQGGAWLHQRNGLGR